MAVWRSVTLTCPGQRMPKSFQYRADSKQYHLDEAAFAGLQPLYIARQLFDMRYGSSAGKAAELMKSTRAKKQKVPLLRTPTASAVAPGFSRCAFISFKLSKEQYDGRRDFLGDH